MFLKMEEEKEEEEAAPAARLSDAEVTEIKAVFALYDSDHKGYLHMNDLKRVLAGSSDLGTQASAANFDPFLLSVADRREYDTLTFGAAGMLAASKVS